MDEIRKNFNGRYESAFSFFLTAQVFCFQPGRRMQSQRHGRSLPAVAEAGALTPAVYGRNPRLISLK
jgi:hypothetical protein